MTFIGRRTEIFDFYPYTDLLYYAIVPTTSMHVETVVLLRGVKTDSHISVKLDVEKLNVKVN